MKKTLDEDDGKSNTLKNQENFGSHSKTIETLKKSRTRSNAQQKRVLVFMRQEESSKISDV